MNATIRMGLSAVLLLIAGGLAAYAPEASAQVGPLKNNGTGFCLGVNTFTGAAISQPCNGSSNQAWSQSPTASGFLLKNVQTGRCLDTNGAGAVFVSACNTTLRTQYWLRLNVTTTSARFRSAATNLLLNSSGTGVINAAPANGLPLQVWSY
jgi:hypothetical protein